MKINQSKKSILNLKNIYSIILSAGLSGRMGKFKPLAEYKGKSFIYNIILKLNLVCDKIIIVTGFKEEDLKNRIIGDLSADDQAQIIKKMLFIQNENYKKGMFTSLQTGLAGARECDWILYHFVDQPGLPNSFYPEFIKQTGILNEPSSASVYAAYNKLISENRVSPKENILLLITGNGLKDIDALKNHDIENKS